jgi:agmatine deiminase
MLMQWPQFWNNGPLDAVRENFALLAHTIAGFEPVWVIASPATAGGARRMLGSVIQVIELPHDDCWVRDNGPIFVRDPTDTTVILDWDFNAWGRKYPNWEKDDAVPSRLAELWGVEYIRIPMILEGGNICTNGAGTLLTVAECLLNPNRNPDMTKAEIEQNLKTYLGADRVVWLPYGLIGDETDGHVDNVCAFIDESTVLMQWTQDPADPNHARQYENRTALRDAGLNVETIIAPPPMYLGAELLTASYVNFVYVRGGIILPQFGGDAAEADAAALAKMKELFPDREIAPVLSFDILRGGGNIHCVTQQIIVYNE